MVITPFPCCYKKQQGRFFTWLSFGSAQPSKVAQFSVGANSMTYWSSAIAADCIASSG